MKPMRLQVRRWCVYGITLLGFVAIGNAQDKIGVLPTITVSPESLTFPNENVGTASASQSLEITNTGKVAVSLGSIVASGDFGVTRGGCGTTLAVDHHCSVSVNFKPSAAGRRTGRLTINDNAAGSPHVVELGGAGQAVTPMLAVSPVGLAFGTRGLNSISTLTLGVTNRGSSAVSISSLAISGANAGDFAVSGSQCEESMSANQTCQIQVSFKPTGTGTRTAALVLTQNAGGSPQTVALTGTGQVTGPLSFTSSTLTFLGQNVGSTSSSQFLFVTNTGTTALTLTSVAITGANANDFLLSDDSCPTSLPAGWECEIEVAFEPTALGTRTAALSFSYNAAGSPQSVGLTGTGQLATEVISLSPNPLSFPAQGVGIASIQQQVTAANTGTAPVTFSKVSIAGTNASDFSIVGNSCIGSLAVGSSCTASLTFTPGAAGTRTATLTFTDNATGSPQSVTVSGTGQTVASLTFNPAAVSFPATSVGFPVSQTITVTNSGSATALINYFQMSGDNSGDFVVGANTCQTNSGQSTPLPAGSSCNVTITFTPLEATPRSANLLISDNAANSPQVLFLGGNGASETQSLAFSNLLVQFSNQAVGTASGTSFLYVTNTGNGPVTFGPVSITGANAGDFNISANNCSGSSGYYGYVLPANQECEISITFLPTAAGSRTAAVTFADNAAGSPQSIMISGNAVTPTSGATLSVSELDFTTTIVGNSSNGSVTISNSGTTPLNIGSVSLSGTNAGDFAITENECASYLNNVVPISSGCYINISFAPSATGTRTANLSVTDSAMTSPQVAVLSGVGQAGTLSATVTPAFLDFGATNVGVVGSTQSLYFSNTGTVAVTLSGYTISGANASDYAISSNGCQSGYQNVIPPGTNCFIYLVFTPGGAGTRAATFSASSNAPGSPSYTVSLQGVGTAVTGGIGVFPTTLSFSAATGVPATPQTVTLANSSNESATISSVAITGPSDYSITSNTCPSAAFVNGFISGETCTIQISYTPSAIGSTTASLGIVTSIGNQAVALNGSGQSPTKVLSVPATSPFLSPQGVGTTTLAQATTIQNTGNEAINLSGFAISGTNAGDFSIGANSCPSSLPAGANCTIGVTFTPSATGARSATLTITSDANGSPQTVALSGTGNTAQNTLFITATALDLGVTPVGTPSAPATYYLQSTNGSAVSISSVKIGGANPGDFSMAPASASDCVIPGSIASTGCSQRFIFTPSALGERTATVTYVDNATGSPQTVLLTGNAQSSAPAVSITGNLSFPVTNIGYTSVAQKITVSNIGYAGVALGNFTLTGPAAGDFTIVNNLCTGNAVLQPQTYCSVYITFSPAGAGLRAANLQITDNTSASPHVIPLEGAGGVVTTSVTVYPNAIDLGSAVVGYVAPSYGSATVYMRVTGTGTLTVSGIAISGTNAGDFAIAYNYCTGSFGPGGYCYLGVSFSPTGAGVRSATLVVTDNADGNNTQTVALSGVGLAPTQVLGISPTVYTFGSLNIGNPSSVTISATNFGTSSVTFTNYTLSGANASDFAISSNNCAATNSLAAGNSCSLQVTVTPSATGTRTAVLTFTDNATGGSQSVALTAVGQNGKTSVQTAPSEVAFTSAMGVTSTTKFAYVTNTGAANITFSGASITGANANDFAISSNSCAYLSTNSNGLVAGTQCSIGLTFTPSTLGIETGTLLVTDSASATPQSIPLAGQGESVQKYLSVIGDYLTFSPVAVASSTYSFIYLGNAGDGQVTISGFTVSGPNAGDFQASSGCPIGTPLSYSYCTISVEFEPSAPGLRTATLQITDNASNTTRSVTLLGSGYAAGSPLIPGNGTFAATPLNSSAPGTSVSFTNNGNSAVTLSAPTVIGADSGDFAISSTTCGTSLAAQSGCTVSVTFTPSASAARYAAVELAQGGNGGTVAYASIVGDGIAGTGYLTTAQPGLEFDATPIDTANTQNSINFQNSGGGSVTFGTPSFSGTNATDFSIDSNSCTGSLNPAISCYIYIQFAPLGGGLRTATLTLPSNASNSPETISLIGVGQTPAEILYASSAALNFGTDPTGTSTSASLSIISGGTIGVNLSSIQITGTNASEFSISSSSSCPTLLTTSCYIGIQFNPAAAGVRTANLVVTSDAPGSPLTIPLTGSGLAPNETVRVSATSLDLGVASIGSQSSSSVYIVNTGTNTVNFTAPTFSGPNSGDFTTSYNGCTSIAPGFSCNYWVAFSPSGLGSRTATLQINDDAPGSPQLVSLAGSGAMVTKLLTSFSNVVNFGPQDVGSAAPASTYYVNLINTGSGTVNISGLAITGTNAADFQVTSGCSQASSEDYCTLYLQFTPSTTGPESATLTVTSDSSAGPVVISLVGQGQTASKTIVASPSTLDFGAWLVGSSAPQVVATILNSGTDPVTLLTTTIAGPNAANFTLLTNWCPITLAAGASCTYNLAFTPSTPGVATATLNVASTATNSPLAITLVGTGTVSSGAVLNVTPQLTFATTPVGTTAASQNATLVNVGSALATISSAVIRGTNASDFLITSNGCSGLSPLGSCSVAVGFKPTATGTRTANLVITDSAPGSPHVISLVGTGQ